MICDLRSAMEACDAQTTLASYYRTKDGFRNASILDAKYYPEPITGDRLDALCSLIIDAAQGDCVWMSNMVSDLIEQPAMGLVSERLRSNDVPAESGIVWIEHNTRLFNDVNQTYLDALGWISIKYGILLLPITQLDGHFIVTDVLGWMFNEPWEVDDNIPFNSAPPEILTEDGVAHCTAWVGAARVLILALWRFMSQEIVESTPMHMPRHVAKRAHRAGTTSLVRIVRLRRVRHPDSPTHESAAREWAYRWWVTGHWRTLHRGLDNERKTWVRPHVKGPDDRPMRPNRQRVISIER